MNKPASFEIYYKLLPVNGSMQLARVTVPTGFIQNMMIRVSDVETPNSPDIEIVVTDYSKIPYLPMVFSISEGLREVVTTYDIENYLIKQGFQKIL